MKGNKRREACRSGPPPSLLALLATLKSIPEAFGQMDDAAPEPVEL